MEVLVNLIDALIICGCGFVAIKMILIIANDLLKKSIMANDLLEKSISLELPKTKQKDAVISIKSGSYETVPHLEISTNDMPWGMYYLVVDVSVKNREGELEVLKVNGKPLAHGQKIHGTRGDRTTQHLIFDLNEKEIEEFFRRIIANNIPYYYTVSVTSQNVIETPIIIKANGFTMSTIVPSDAEIEIAVKKNGEWEE